jgi:hypothetical protein
MDSVVPTRSAENDGDAVIKRGQAAFRGIMPPGPSTPDRAAPEQMSCLAPHINLAERSQFGIKRPIPTPSLEVD